MGVQKARFDVHPGMSAMTEVKWNSHLVCKTKGVRHPRPFPLHFWTLTFDIILLYVIPLLHIRWSPLIILIISTLHWEEHLIKTRCSHRQQSQNNDTSLPFYYLPISLLALPSLGSQIWVAEMLFHCYMTPYHLPVVFKGGLMCSEHLSLTDCNTN